MKSALAVSVLVSVLFMLTCPASALERPWIGDVFFYWYTWDYDRELGSWLGGIHNTPLGGYYDSRTLRDNRRSLWLASEWGMTHHFMDYWTPDWKGEGGQMREAIVMRAAESLRKAGYDISMAYYQDGQNFEMRKFSRNVSEKRDVHQWLRDFARSEVWPKIAGSAVQLVYSRNGRPQTTLDHPGFRRFLQDRYKDVAELNEVWQTDFGDFDEIEMTFNARGHQRAASIEFQYRIWEREWQKLDGLVRREFGLPGMRASFDVGYGPYEGFGFAEFARVFGGPHSYAGIFGPPHEQDAQRFIQAAVAKKYDTVFLDHFKNYYFDWDIRVPGTAYMPDPFHFDRFWVGALARHSEALLHLSWNEWWEGSNLEPCREFGKTYCEKNLFYATLMKLAFPSIRDAGHGAPVAVILNDWRFASGAGSEEELYGTIQTLRRLGVPFDLLPDGLVTAERLEDFQLVVAPACGCGLGYNNRHQRILDVLAAWLKGGKRRLIVSAHPSVAEICGLREVEPPQPAPGVPGDDLNVFVDVGAEGDQEFLRSGYSHREVWGGGAKPSLRWTPASGNETTLLLPASPNRDHVLRLTGVAIWPNKVSIIANGRKAGTVELPVGQVRVETAVPAAAIGSAPMVRLQLQHAEMHVPGKKAPQRHQGESRVCNLALDCFQWSTANVPADARVQKYAITEDSIRLVGEHFGPQGETVISVPFQSRPYVAAPGAKVLSVRRIGQVPRDVAVAFGPSEVLYVNGMLSEITAEEYWLPLLRRWAGIGFQRFAAGPHCMASRLQAGDTELVVCFNEEIGQTRRLQLSIPARAAPLSEAAVLTRDGRMYQPLEMALEGTTYQGSDAVEYYGVYQFAFSPVKIETPSLALQPGQSEAFSVQVTNLTPGTVRGRIAAASVIPTITGKPVQIELEPRQTKTVPLEISAAPTADWGRKTVYFKLDFDGRQAVVLRELIVQKPAEVELGNVILEADSPRIELRVPENPYGQTAALSGAVMTFRGRAIQLPTIPEGGRATVSLPPLDVPPPARPMLQAERVKIDFGPARAEAPVEREVFVAMKPKNGQGPADASAALLVFNARSKPLDHELLTAKVADMPQPYCVRTEDGDAVPAQLDAAGRLRFVASMPGRSPRVFYLCHGQGEVSSDLRCSANELATGKGTLEVENSHLSVTLSEAAGGTVTSLRSLRTGRDYGRNSLGIAYGTFSHHDPAQPRTDTVQYIKESKARQEDSPGRIELLSQGPAAVLAQVKWADERVQVEQTYEFRAYQPYFVVRQRVTPVRLDDQQELVGFNAQFQPNRLTKSYPNFVGCPSDKDQPHFGWRQGTWVPDYATLMAPNDFDESLSLVIAGGRGLSGIRQGFWPGRRPNPGKCELAQIELLADTAAGCDAEVYVLLHQGHQIVAKQFLADLRCPPRVELLTRQ